MSDINDRLKFNSGTDKVTKSVADAVSDVLNSGQAPKSRFEQQAELMGYPLQDKPEVAETFVAELKQDVAKMFQDNNAFITAAMKAKKDGKAKFMFQGKEYPTTIKKQDEASELDPVNKDAVKKKFKDRKDKDIDNDGDVDSSDKFLHKKRKAISKAMGKEEIKYDARSKSFKETLRRLGYVKKDALIYDNKKSGK
tara:strand:+ start:19 stop:606 length:588 start_codon:yes stop_codon:yes gene_type:complete